MIFIEYYRYALRKAGVKSLKFCKEHISTDTYTDDSTTLEHINLAAHKWLEHHYGQVKVYQDHESGTIFNIYDNKQDLKRLVPTAIIGDI